MMSEAIPNEKAIEELNGRFICAVRESYANYNEHGARSNKKLRPLHQWIADEMVRVLGEEYVVKGLRKDGEGKEEKVLGKYYDKNVDISISKQDSGPLAIISAKFIASNYQQNANNYFEHLMGETANIRRMDVAVGHLMVIPYELPYLNNQKEITKTEILKSENLQKYVKLARDENHPHRPDAIGIVVISLPLEKSEDDIEIELMDVNQMCVREETKDALLGDLSVQHLMCKMKDLVEEKG